MSTPAHPASLRRWLATADAAPARWARRALRAANRLRARRRSGSVAEEMDRIVAEAHDTTAGSGLDVHVAHAGRVAVPPSPVTARRPAGGGDRPGEEQRP